MMDYKAKARNLLNDWKKDNYYFGIGSLDKIGELAKRAGKSVLLVLGGLRTESWIEPVANKIQTSLKNEGIIIADVISGAPPNSPKEDVYRIANQITKIKPDCIIAVGGGSTIDAAKAAVVISTLKSDDIEDYFGVGFVTKKLQDEGKKLPALIAVQTAASSGAHLTKYSNITDPAKAQKKLIIDEAITPPYALFDYSIVSNAPYSLKADGALDGISHCIEVVCGAAGRPFFEKTMEIAEAGISLIVENLPQALSAAVNNDAIEGLGLGTDMGGYAIMVGSTNFSHLFSFSLVNKITHGRACAIANPYVLVFFSPAIQPQLKLFGRIFAKAGYIKGQVEKFSGRDLGVMVADGMIKFLEEIKFPATFGELGVDQNDKNKILNAAKNPQLWSKLEQAPVSLIIHNNDGSINIKETEQNIDEHLGQLLDAVISGDLNSIKVL